MPPTSLTVEARHLRVYWPRPNGEPATVEEVFASVKRLRSGDGGNPRETDVRYLLARRIDLFERLEDGRYRVLDPAWPPGAPPGAHVVADVGAAPRRTRKEPDEGEPGQTWPPEVSVRW